MSYPRKTTALNGDYLRGALDWDAMVDAVNGLTIAGVRYSPYTHIIRISGGTYESLDRFFNLEYGGSTDEGGVDGTDAGEVLRAAAEATADNNVNRIYMGPGVYDINSLGYDSDEDCYYAVGFPEAATEKIVSLEGAAMPFWAGMSTLGIQTQGTLLNITSTAMSDAGAKDVAGVWNKEPVNPYIGNYVYLQDCGLRFPSNQAANSLFGVNLRYANSTRLQRLNIDFATQYNTMVPSPLAYATGSAGVVTNQSSLDTCYMEHVYATGFNLGFRFDTEHVNAIDCAAFQCNYPFSMGQAGGPIYHPNNLIHFQDLHNINGPVFDTYMQKGSVVNLLNYDIEYTDSGDYTRLTGATEVNLGHTTGDLTYTSVLAATGLTVASFWATGSGERFNTRCSNYGAWGTRQTEGLIWYAPMDEPSGAVTDFSLYRNNAALSGAVTRVTGYGGSGKACSFSGSTYLDVTSAVCLDGYGAVSLAAWVYPTAHHQYGGIISKGNVGGVPIYGLYLGDATQKIRFAVTNSADQTKLLESTDALTLNAWSHVAGSYDGADSYLYVNGELIDTEAFTGTLKADSTNLQVGKLSSGSNYFEGYIDEAAAWNRSLGQLEFQSIMYKGLLRA